MVQGALKEQKSVHCQSWYDYVLFQGKTTEIVVINREEGTRSAVHDTLPIFNVKVMQCNVFSEEDVNKKRPNQPTMTRYVKLRFCTKDF